eukprot:2860393-Rhodomonas_salina.1
MSRPETDRASARIGRRHAVVDEERETQGRDADGEEGHAEGGPPHGQRPPILIPRTRGAVVCSQPAAFADLVTVEGGETLARHVRSGDQRPAEQSRSKRPGHAWVPAPEIAPAAERGQREEDKSGEED